RPSPDVTESLWLRHTSVIAPAKHVALLCRSRLARWTMQRSFLLASLICYFLSISLFAQDRAAINGAVKDASGAVVSGARVDLVSPATGLHRTAVSSVQGLYEITPLPVGSYTLTITAAGFKPTTIREVELDYGETRTVDAQVEVGGITEVVTVDAVAEAP